LQDALFLFDLAKLFALAATKATDIETIAYLCRQGPPPVGHPYKNWLALYASPEFAEVARWMREAIDQWTLEAGPVERARMEQAFVISSRYEWSFWEMAWREERWPI
jgi:thiaminase/transcriptional activator TenA